MKKEIEKSMHAFIYGLFGSVDIYFGPDKPAGDKAKNWIPTEAGRGWFPYFRLYSPQQAFLDRSWVLPNIEKMK